MTEIEKYLNLNAYSLKKEIKKKLFLKIMNILTKHHYNNSPQYKSLIDNLFKKKESFLLDEVPFLPTLLFKNKNLKSISNEKVFKILTSSGTSGNVSNITLDKKNASNQTKILNKIVVSIFGKERLPMLIIDSDQKLKNRNLFNAKKAAVQGFSIFGKDHTYLLDDKQNIKYKTLNQFLEKYHSDKFLIFGFTSNVFKNLYNQLKIENIRFNFENGILLHGGGWKKMEDQKISNELFKKKLNNKLNIKNIFNYYGLVEQTGSIFLECPKCNSFKSSIFSEVLIRDKNFKICKKGKIGLVQLFSVLPTSYPGHSIITDDIGEILPDHKIKCESDATHFIIHGRSKESELRGCSDV